MKHTSIRSPRRTAAISLGCLALGLGAATLSAQSSSSTSGTAANGSSGSAHSSSSGMAGATSKQESRFLMKAHASGIRELQWSQLAATRATNPQVKSYAQQLVSEHQQMAQDMKPLLTAAGLDASLPSGVVGSATGSARTETYAAGGTNSSSAGTSGTGAAGTSATGSAGSYPSGATAGGTSTSTSTGVTPGRDSGVHSTAGNSGSYHTEDAKKSGSLRDRWSRMLSDRQQQKLAKKSGADFDKAYIDLMVDEHQDAVDLFEDAIEDNVSAGAQGFATKYLPKLQQHLTQAKQLEDALD